MAVVYRMTAQHEDGTVDLAKIERDPRKRTEDQKLVQLWNVSIPEGLNDAGLAAFIRKVLDGVQARL